MHSIYTAGSNLATNMLGLWQRWGSKVTYSVADQGISAGANFVLNILLVRWISLDQYGAFAIAFSMFLFLAGFYSALTLDPMSVLGPTRHSGHVPKYLGSLIWIHVGLTLPLSLVFAVAGLILLPSSPALAVSFLGLAMAQPFILFLWFFRQACYLNTRPDFASKGSLLYAVLLLASLFALQSGGWISPFTAFGAMAFASVGACLALGRSLRIEVKQLAPRRREPSVRHVLHEHWVYGRWIAAASLANGVSSFLYLPLIGGLLGLAQAGAFRGMQNLILPFQQMLIALALLLLPWLSKQNAAYGTGYLKKAAVKVTLVDLLFGTGYALLLIVLGQVLLELLYGNDNFNQFTWMLVPFAAVVLLAAITQSFGIVVRVVQRPDAILWSKLAAALCVLGLGVLCTLKWGLYGTMFSLILSGCVEAVVLLYYLVRKL